MAERRLQTFLQEVQVEVLPKSVLLVRGWEENTLAQFEQVWSDLYNCHAYKVPVQRMTWSDAHEYAEEQVLEHERQCAQRRGKKGDEALDVPSAPTGKDPKGTSEAAQGKKVRAAGGKGAGPLNAGGQQLDEGPGPSGQGARGGPGRRVPLRGDWEGVGAVAQGLLDRGADRGAEQAAAGDRGDRAPDAPRRNRGLEAAPEEGGGCSGSAPWSTPQAGAEEEGRAEG